MFTEVKKTSAYWNFLNKAINPTVHKSIGPLKRDDGSLALTDEEKASLMNSYSAAIGEKLAAALPCVDNGQQSIVHITNTSTEPPPLAELMISQNSVNKKVNTLKTNKSTGPDNIPSKLLKVAGNAIVPPLMGLYWYSCARKAVFSAWKTARLNYRPVS